MPSKVKIKIMMGDITQMEVDAIVNAANTSLLGGGGVDGAIHKASGPELLVECKALEGCITGQAKITRAYQLPAKFIIHAVGPVWRGGVKGEAKLLAACYTHSLKLALDHDLKTIAFPAISCGIYSYPAMQAAAIAIKEVMYFLEEHPVIEEVYFVCFDATIYAAYLQAFDSFQS